MKDEIYFCLSLTENEHSIVENQLFNIENSELIYYRKLKDGHIPTYREVKIIALNRNYRKILKYLKKDLNLEFWENPWKIKRNEE